MCVGVSGVLTMTSVYLGYIRTYIDVVGYYGVPFV